MQARHTEVGKPLSYNEVSESATEPDEIVIDSSPRIIRCAHQHTPLPALLDAGVSPLTLRLRSGLVKIGNRSRRYLTVPAWALGRSQASSPPSEKPHLEGRCGSTWSTRPAWRLPHSCPARSPTTRTGTLA